MAKRGSVSSSSKRFVEEEPAEIEVTDELVVEEELISDEELDAYARERIALEKELSSEAPVIRMVLLKALKLNILGPVTGKLYVFNGAGSELDVDKEDADIMIMRKSSRDCCSGTKATSYFEIIE